ncbi:hypothetical protein [Pseudomonas endophytica]|uniref:hypothetical protein n=1 Tax=Pseudomonas endophytica TaxID=1563157 RepID=UPI0012E0E879|nr:hypothetical protein [Pseudomonas endophytica]
MLLFFAGAAWSGVLPKADFFVAKDIHELAETGAAIATIFAVVFGLSAWKKQLRGQSDHELARKLLLETERLKAQALVITRTADNCKNSSNLQSADWSVLQKILSILRADLAKSHECRSNMEAILIEADVMWGDELRMYYSEVLELFDMCQLYIQSNLDFLDDTEIDMEGDDLSWIENRLSEGGWNLDERKRRERISILLSQATGYLKEKLVS